MDLEINVRCGHSILPDMLSSKQVLFKNTGMSKNYLAIWK